MLHKTVIKTAALAVLAVSVAASSATSASAGGYGHSYKNNSGYAKANARRPFAHIQDRIWRKHSDWCHARFRTYNTFDNTYQPYNGPRQQCWSPYIGR